MRLMKTVMALGMLMTAGVCYGDACSDYADKSMQQVKAEAILRCGNTSSDWSRDRDHHLRYCQQVGDMGYINQMLTYRKLKLTSCLSAETHLGNCEAYAARAKWQSGAAMFLGCSFANSGGRWAYDYDAHFNWCRAAGNMGYADGEDKARRDQLIGCL